jgi:hypothetical protein
MKFQLKLKIKVAICRISFETYEANVTNIRENNDKLKVTRNNIQSPIEQMYSPSIYRKNLIIKKNQFRRRVVCTKQSKR